MFLPDFALLSDLSDTLQKEQGSLQDSWNNILTQSHSWAYQTIVSELSSKGYTVAQINAWDAGADWERNLTLWRALTRGAALQSVDDKLIATYDVRKDLKELQGLIINGAYQYPQGDPGTVGVGDVDTSTDIFVLPASGGLDPFDDFPGEGRGRRTRL